MRLRSIVKIVVFLLLPATAAFLFIRTQGAPYWAWLTEKIAPDLKDADVPGRIAATLIWLAGALILFQLLKGLLSPERSRRRGKTEMPALLRDLIQYGVFIVAVALILRIVWGEQVSPLIGALGIGGVVLGLALQETLSNFFAGLALLAEQPFTQGDWIQIGSAPEGQVEHVTWRATKIRTRNNDYLIFPNSMVAKELVNNFRLPNVLHAVRLYIGTSYEDPPDKVKQVLIDVLASVPSVLRNPPPIVYVKAYADFSINYEIKCFIDNYERRPIVEDEVMNKIWYAFRRANIEIPFPIRTVYDYRLPTEHLFRKNVVDVIGLLESVPIFSPLTREERALLAERAAITSYGSGEMLIRQGDAGDTLYAIASGGARVTVRAEDGVEREVARLTAGQVVGEMSLLTGEPRSASVHADGCLVLCSVSKDALTPILAGNPALAERMAEVVALRKQGIDRVHQEAAASRAPPPEVQAVTRSLASRIRQFFRL